MRIGLVIDHFDPRLGGVEQWTQQLAKNLVARGHEVHVVAETFGVSTETSVPVGPHDGLLHHPFEPARSRLTRARAAAAVLKTLSLDVIHDMGVGWHCDVLQPHVGSRHAAFEQNQLLVPRWQRPWKRLAAQVLPRYREFGRLMEKQYRDGDRLVVALSQMVRHDLKRYHRVPDERIRLIYNGVDVARFSPEHRGTYRDEVRARLGVGDQTLFLIVAHNLRLKGLPSLLEAMALLLTSGFAAQLIVVGGRRLKRFRWLAERLGVDRVVHFLGPVHDVVPYYAVADVYVQPTFYDPCSLVVLEALASGLPVITSRFNGAGELMTHGEHGYLLDDPADARRLADQMSLLLEYHRRQPMSEAARRLALTVPLEKNIEQILAVYREAQERRRQKNRPSSFAA